MDRFINLEIKYLKGVGPKRAELIGQELGIYSIHDLLHYYPYKYIDRSKIYRIKDLDVTVTVQETLNWSGFGDYNG